MHAYIYIYIWLLKFIRAQISHEVSASEIKQFHIQFHTTLSHHVSDGFGAHAFQINYVKHLLPCDMFLQVFQTACLGVISHVGFTPRFQAGMHIRGFTWQFHIRISHHFSNARAQINFILRFQMRRKPE